jgi:3-oxoacyl-[acyl-carrier protein] reductase
MPVLVTRHFDLMISLENQVAIVTGAGRGIGRAVAIDLGRLGMSVALVARSRLELEETSKAVPGSLVCVGDVRIESDVQRVVRQAERQFGSIDVLVNCAGVYHFGDVASATSEDFDRVLETNLKGVFFACRAVLPNMKQKGRGHIINVASIAGKVGTPNRAIYCASKFGVVGLSEALAQEVREQGVRVSVLCPGSTNTTFSPKELEGKSRARMLQPGDVAHAVRMLLGQEANSFISEIVMRPTRKP